MHPLPLVLRELYVAGRSRAISRWRMAFGAGGMGLTVWSFLVWGAAHGNGRWIYASLLLLAAVLAMFAAILIAADSLSRERREGTLGFLFLTDLRATDVILGKFAAVAIVPAWMLLAFFPGLALCQLMGGIAGWEFARGLAALVVTLFFSLAATLFVSAQCVNHRKSLAGSALLLLFVNPIWLCFASLQPAYQAAPLIFWVGLPAMLVFGVVFLSCACGIIAGAWQHNEPIKKDQAYHASVSAGAIPEGDPVSWMMLRRRSRNSRGAWFPIVLPAVAFVAALPLTAPILWPILCVALLLVAHLAVQFLVFLRTAYSFYTDRQDGSLELLLGTQLTPVEIFTGFITFLFKQTAPLLLVLGVLDLFAAFFLWSAGARFAILPIAFGGTLGLTVLGLGWTGVYRSLMSNHPAVALLSTFLRLSLLPTAIALLLFLAPNPNFSALAMFLLTSTGFAAMFFAIDASAALRRHGRELLLRPFSEKPPEIENEWSFINWDEESASPNFRFERPQLQTS